jgi:nucleoside-diphosphate-sugar epimerase
MKTVFVTGISGLLGTNLAIDLLENGHKVLGLVRDKKRYKGISHTNLELIERSLEDDLAPWLDIAEVVVHVAAETRQNLTSYSDYLKINFVATQHLYDSAVRSTVKKFVFVSTANTMGYGSLEDPGHEGREVRFPFSDSFYARSKIEAENYVLRKASEMETIIVNPTFMLGPYDTKPSSGKIILMGWKKRFIFYPPGGKNFVHVRDVSDGIIKALESGRHGERYLLAHENLSYRQFYEMLNAVADQDARLIAIPKPALMLLGHFGDFLRKLGIRSSLSSTNTRILCVNNYYSNQKSREKLGLNYSSTDQSIRDAIDYFGQAE